MSGDRAPRLPSRLGPYEIGGALGSGGMGEVYRARDTRLERDVALKILPEEFSANPERLRRFEQEARTVSALNHPNIVTVYDVGAEGSVSYIAMEFIEGRTLRELFRAGPLPLKRALEIAAPVAEGLARAHEAGIVHRDIKPENVMVTRDGVVKILDFGLAKRTFSPGAKKDEPTATFATEAGAVLGTVRYMSPEQAAGQPIDFRSDQFSFGSVLYEMAAGKPAFSGDTKVDTLSAILHDEPEPVGLVNPKVPAPLRWVVERCLAKEPKYRYASTQDLAHDLASLRGHLSDLSSAPGALSAAAPQKRYRFGPLLPIAGILAAFAAVYLWGERAGRSHVTAPRFRQITFQHGGVTTARFAPDGETIVYAASREGRAVSLFSGRTESPEARSLGLDRAQVLSISPSAEMAVLLGQSFGTAQRPPHNFMTERDPRLLYGTLARVSFAGGAPRELLDEVREADWGPDGKDLAVVHFVGGKDRLEYPIGRPLYESSSWLNHPRVSPKGDRVAFARGFTLMVVDMSGKDRKLAEQMSELAWSTSGEEIWFSRVSAGTTDIRAVTPAGKERLMISLPGDFVLFDVSKLGRVLLGQVFQSAAIFGLFPGESRERNLSWLDRSTVVDMSADGQIILFSERGGTIYVRKTDGSPAKLLGSGSASALSPDGRFVLTGSPSGLLLLPTGAGETRRVDIGRVSNLGKSGFFPDGRRIFFMGEEAGRGRRTYVVDLSGGKPHPITPEGTRRTLLSGDGRFVTARAADGTWYLYPTESGPSRAVVGLLPGEEPMQWSADGKLLYVRGPDEMRPGETVVVTRVCRLDPRSGRRELWKEIPPVAPTTGGEVGQILFADEGRVCVYTYHHYSADLFLVEGLR